MKKIFKKLGYYLSFPFVALGAFFTALGCRRLARKYIKRPNDVLLETRLKKAYKAFKKYLWIKRVKYVAEGLDDIHQKQYLYIANHKSSVDPMVIFNALYESGKIGATSFIAKIELSRNFASKAVMTLLDGIFLQRDSGRSIWECYNKEMELIKKGHSIIVFPEGTRVPGDGFQEFQPAVLKVAYQNLLPIAPVAIYGSEKRVDKKQFITNVSVSFLKPVQPTSFMNIKQEQLMNTIQEQVFAKYSSLKQNPLVETPKKK